MNKEQLENFWKSIPHYTSGNFCVAGIDFYNKLEELDKKSEEYRKNKKTNK